jgi:hypothetical protein
MSDFIIQNASAPKKPTTGNTDPSAGPTRAYQLVEYPNKAGTDEIKDDFFKQDAVQKAIQDGFVFAEAYGDDRPFQESRQRIATQPFFGEDEASFASRLAPGAVSFNEAERRRNALQNVLKLYR